MNNYLLITAAVAVLAFTCCLATPLDAGKALPQDLLVPFNDLLPPLLDTEATNTPGDTTKTTTTTPSPPLSTTTSTTTTTTTKKPTTPAPTSVPTTAKASINSATTNLPALLFKSTKKSYYQQQTEHIKELHLIDEDVYVPHDYSVQAEHLQHLHDGQQQQQHPVQQQQHHIQQQSQQLRQQQPQYHQPQKVAQFAKAVKPQTQHVASNSPKKATSFNVSKTHAKYQTEKLSTGASRFGSESVGVPHVGAATHAQPQYFVHNQQQQQQRPRYQQQQHQQHQQQQQQLQRYQQEPQQQFQHQRPNQHRFQVQQPHAFSHDALQQYIDFQFTTQRPPKAGLPTLTPFPRHLK